MNIPYKWKTNSKYSCHCKDNVSVWWPKVHNIAHPLCVWIITALASGTPVFAKGLLWRRLPPPQTQWPMQLQRLTLYSPTQHWREESIETAVTVDHHRESGQCFVLNEVAVIIQQEPQRSQCMSHFKCLDLMFSLIVSIIFYSESLSCGNRMDTPSLSFWRMNNISSLFRCIRPVKGAAV